jgi:hypothetical protein
MAKLKADAIATPDLLEYLSSYSDFSFELTVLKMLRESGLECEHGGLYEDPVTGKSREFDIRAIKTMREFRVRLAVECKNIRDNFPILISCIPRHLQESYHEVALVGTPKSDSRLFAVNYLLQQSRAQPLSIRGDYSIYKPQQPVGKSIAQIGRAIEGSISANDAEIYEKWGQSLSSAADLVQRSYSDGDDARNVSCTSMVIPFVVVPDGRLWSVMYDNDGNRVSDPILTHRCSCFIGKDYQMGGKLGVQIWLSHVEIVTASGMASFISNYLSTEEGIANLFPQDGLIEAFARAYESQFL